MLSEAEAEGLVAEVEAKLREAHERLKASFTLPRSEPEDRPVSASDTQVNTAVPEAGCSR